ncbi:xanthine phosphoribosyltransferase [Candidatus Acetothermia bacterium]|nr:MAG: xanthine phosphoribosyltransferase [Candidatus Acetothermia bacterium]
MNLQDWIHREGAVISLEFLRVDGFLNHRIEPAFIEEVGKQLAERFTGHGVTCVLTAEAAGNIVAYEVARRLGVHALYAKKGEAITMNRPLLRTIPSPTKGTKTKLAVSQDYLGAEERVLIVDDFLYRGRTSAALADIVRESGAALVGFGFVIAKEFGEGRRLLARYGVPIVTLVSVIRMDPKSGEIVFGDGAADTG